MDNRLVDKYDVLVRKYVGSFCFKFDGFKNSALIDKDDLYQECMARIIELYLASGKTVDEFELKHVELFQTMHMYVKKCLPVRTAYRTTTYTKDVSKYANTERIEDVKDLSDQTVKQDDIDFKVDADKVQSALSGVERRIFKLARAGYTNVQSYRALGISKSKFRWHKAKIASTWNTKLHENRHYDGSKR